MTIKELRATTGMSQKAFSERKRYLENKQILKSRQYL